MNHKRFDSTWSFANVKADAIATCPWCKHSHRFTAQEFIDAFGVRPVWLHLARKRLRCSHCGHRGAKVTPMDERFQP